MGNNGMAVSHDLMSWTREADADLSEKQYYFVKLAASNKMSICSSQGEQAFGVLQNKPDADGIPGTVMIEGITNLICHDTNIVVGSLLTTDANGKAEVAASADFVRAIALEAAAAEDDVIAVKLIDSGIPLA